MVFIQLFRILFLVCICTLTGQCVGALFLSEIPTPSFLIDVDALGKQGRQAYDKVPNIFLRLPAHDCHFVAQDIEGQRNMEVEQKMSFLDVGGREPIGLMHSSVIRAREGITSNDYDIPQGAFLAEIDLIPSHCSSLEEPGSEKEAVAELVLGVNNHHVGPYYWARSAGSGAFMEAPGIKFGWAARFGMNKGILRWSEEGGPLDCNSNDGKRSEWVNFLRVGDNVQLLPLVEEDALISFSQTFPDRIFGYSIKDRPLGSEPLIVCKWVKEESNS